MVHAVIDASVFASWFMPDETNGKYEVVFNNIDKIKVHVPSIFSYEFINILLNAHKKNRIDQSTAVEILETISNYPIIIDSSTGEFRENKKILEMAQIYDLTAYDTAYLELALRLNMPLMTYDKPLLNIAKKLKLRTAL